MMHDENYSYNMTSVTVQMVDKLGIIYRINVSLELRELICQHTISDVVRIG